MLSAYLVVAHGSREPSSARDFFDFLDRLRPFCPGRAVRGAFLELSRPAVAEAIEGCISEGIRQIFVVPLMLFAGRHVREDIPRAIEEAKAKHPDVDFHYTGPLAEEPAVAKLLGEKIAAWKANS